MLGYIFYRLHFLIIIYIKGSFTYKIIFIELQSLKKRKEKHFSLCRAMMVVSDYSATSSWFQLNILLLAQFGSSYGHFTDIVTFMTFCQISHQANIYKHRL